MPVAMAVGHFRLTRHFLPQLRPPGASGCTRPPAAGAAGREAFLHTLPPALRPLGLEAVTPSIALSDAAATWTNAVSPNRSPGLPPSQELCKQAVVPAKGSVSPSPPTQPPENSGGEPPSGREDSYPCLTRAGGPQRAPS